ncbi:MAG: CCA tRNA nucleotidyltransferase [Enterococcus sp.]
MKIENLPKEFTDALPVMRKIEEAGYEAYFVGGSVRDVLLNHPIHDVDIATSAFPAEIKALFARTIDIGIEHGTVLVLQDSGQYEITTFRTESTYQDYRRPDTVEFVRSLAEDLKRRDFTINAFALQENGQIIDLFGGLADLDKQSLRAVGAASERFNEDALRMMRGLRFVSQLGFRFEEQTFQAICANSFLLGKISVERIYVEFTKLLLGKKRNQAIELFVQTKCFNFCPALKDQQSGLLAFARLPEYQLSDEAQAWSLLCDQINLSDHEVRRFLKAWKASNELILNTREILWGLRQRRNHQWRPMELYRLGVTRALKAEELLIYFNQEGDCDALTRQVNDLPIHQLPDLAINGHHLLQHFHRKPGKWLKEVLAACEEAVVTQAIPNQVDAVLAYAKVWLQKAEGQ